MPAVLAGLAEVQGAPGPGAVRCCRLVMDRLRPLLKLARRSFAGVFCSRLVRMPVYGVSELVLEIWLMRLA